MNGGVRMSGKRISYICGLCGKEERRRIKDGEPAVSLCNVNKIDGTHLWIDSSRLDFHIRMKLKKSTMNFNPQYMYYLGNKYIEDNPSCEYVKRAIKCFREAADGGIKLANLKLGYMYYYNMYDMQDKSLSIKYFLRAAHAGEYRAMLVVALIYEEGDGIERNIEEAIRWYRKYAKRVIDKPNFFIVIGAGIMSSVVPIADVRQIVNSDDKYDLERLGYAYENGIAGVDKNMDKAIKYYLEASDAGREFSMYSLGNAYAKGDSVNQDMSIALEWYRKAVIKKMFGNDRVMSSKEIISNIFENIDNNQ